ncbi:MAG: hypothetical protein AB7P22_14945 [Vicinamibacterales bacterium]
MLLALLASPAAAEHHALVVTGASGDVRHAARFNTWRASLVLALVESLGYSRERIVVLTEASGKDSGPATADGVASALRDLAQRTTADDTLLVVLIGHGTVFEGPDARFNLVGPDLTAAQWAAQIAPLRARLVFVNTAAGSYEFVRTLAREGRTVISATDTSSQRYVTVFPEYFINGLVDAAADLDKDSRVSVWEAFTFASAGVSAWFKGEGRLPTERALIDDTGDGVGREASGEGRDGERARLTFLQEDAAASSDDPASAKLLAQRQSVSDAIDRLRLRRAEMPAAEYDAELEKLLVELARLDRELRTRP